MMTQKTEIAERKQQLRHQLRKLRHDQQMKDALSEKLFERLYNLNQFSRAESVLYYVDARDEVRTKSAIKKQLELDEKVIVPYCIEGGLKLVEIREFAELALGTYGILEPAESVKATPDRVVYPAQIDIALVPGIGFDASGGRIGHGKGYYDHLLPMLSNDCLRIGIAFDCQLAEQIPIEPHDQKMDLIVTPTRTIDCRN